MILLKSFFVTLLWFIAVGITIAAIGFMLKTYGANFIVAAIMVIGFVYLWSYIYDEMRKG